ISIDEIQLDQLLPTKKVGINFKGDLNFDGDLEGDFSNPASLSGEVNGEVENFHLDKTTYEGFNIPELTLKKGKFKGSLLKGELKLEVFEFGSPSEDLHVLFEGKIKLGRRLQFSQADLIMKMKFSPRVQQDLKAIIPLIQPALKPDGYYAFLIKGRLGGGLPLPVPLP
ncbi:MAG TPA: type II secretion system protein GspN, partial [Bdellovibrionota bacterium]|nr:type II secretion system protein GspN [Bdellovibrionota bacterium]